MSDSRPFPASLPRPLRIVAVVVAAIALTGFFVYLGFPYDALAARLSGDIQQRTGLRLQYGAVTASPQLLGPGIAVDDLRAQTAGGTTWEFSRLALRPAWSTSWLSATPSLHIDGESALGRVSGTVRVASEDPAFDLEGEELDLAGLLRMLAPGQGRITGSAEIAADVQVGPDGAAGPVTIRATEGVLSHPGLPIDVPYQTLEGELLLGGEHLAQIVSLDVTSPMGSGRLSGTIGRARVPARAPLDLDLEIQVEENMRAALRAQRVQVGPDGKLQLKVQGTLSRPVAR